MTLTTERAKASDNYFNSFNYKNTTERAKASDNYFNSFNYKFNSKIKQYYKE